MQTPSDPIPTQGAIARSRPSETLRRRSAEHLPGQAPGYPLWAGGMRAPDAPHPSDGVLAVLWRRRVTLLLVALLALSAAIAYVQLVTPLYTATAQIYVDRGVRILSDAHGVMVPSDNYLRTQSTLIESLPVLSRAADMPGVRQMKTLRDCDPVAYLKANLSADVSKGNDIISVSLEANDPEEAAQLVNDVVKAYMDHQSTEGRAVTDDVVTILRKQKQDREEQLARHQKQLLDYIAVNGSGTYDGKDVGDVVGERLRKLSDSLTAAQVELGNAKAAAAALELVRSDPAKVRKLAEVEHQGGTLSTTDARLADQLQQQLSDAELRVAVLRRQYPDGHPIIQNARVYIEQLRQKLTEQDSAIAKAYEEAVQARAAAAQSKETVFREQFEAAQKETFGVNVKAAEFARLDSDVKRSQKLVEMLEDRINELTMTQSGGPLSIKVVESATPVRQPSFPSKKRTVALGLMLGLMLGSALALVREQTDQRLRSAEDVASVLGIPVLGVVPYMGTGHSVATRGRKMHLDPLSDVAEAVRTIRTAVHFGVPGAAPRTLLVTSAAPGDGKSTIASNLAIAVAQAGRRTLLLDADFRRPSVDEIFELKGALGLSHVLAGTQSVDSALQPTDVENLHVLPCGPVPANPAELLNSTAFGKLLEELSGRYDFVVLDSPPVLPVTDARIVAAYCDVTLLVLRAGKSSRRQAEQAHSALLSVGARVLGGVMNGAAVRRGNDGYYAPYGYYDPEAGLRSPGAGMGRQPKLTNLALVSPPSRWLTNGEKDQSAGRSGDVEDVRSAQNGGDRLQ